MAQSFSLYGELSVRQNLALHAALYGLDEATARQRGAALAERFDLVPYLDAVADALPMGVRQRLSLAVAIIHEPEILILDEPTSGVDPVAREMFWQDLLRLSRERSEEHTSELQSLMRTSYAVFCLKKKKTRLSFVML